MPALQPFNGSQRYTSAKETESANNMPSGVNRAISPANHPDHQVDAAKRALAQTIEFIDIGLRFKSAQQARLSAYLKS